MIISRFISKEIIVNICWISLVLFGLVLLSRFNIFLSQAEVGKISAENIFLALLLFSPELLSFIFPISVFLAVGFVLTPIYKTQSSILDFCSYSPGKMFWGQKILVISIFGISLFLSTTFSPYYTSMGQKLIDQDNTFAAKVARPNGLVPLHSNGFNAFAEKTDNGFEDIIFFDTQSTSRFVYGKEAVIDKSDEDTALVVTNGFLFDQANQAISKFETAKIPLNEPQFKNFVSLKALYLSSSASDHVEFFQRISFPIFCLLSMIFSILFSSYSSFFGREKTYFMLAIINILYLVFTISVFEPSVTKFNELALNFFLPHGVFLLLILFISTNSMRRLFGYEGL